ncbi:MAG: hypothetical protein RI975_935, partial [Pseudomonadota bacterium]
MPQRWEANRQLAGLQAGARAFCRHWLCPTRPAACHGRP